MSDLQREEHFREALKTWSQRDKAEYKSGNAVLRSGSILCNSEHSFAAQRIAAAALFFVVDWARPKISFGGAL